MGIMLVAACPGGTASNVVTYIARADVALSVLMTTCSTLATEPLTAVPCAISSAVHSVMGRLLAGWWRTRP